MFKNLSSFKTRERFSSVLSVIWQLSKGEKIFEKNETKERAKKGNEAIEVAPLLVVKVGCFDGLDVVIGVDGVDQGATRGLPR